MRDLLFGTLWRRMIVLKIAILIALFVYKTQHYQYMAYQHLLVDYHFGFIKRALIGAAWSLVFPKVPIWAVYVTGGLVLGVALSLFVAVFRRLYGFNERHLPLFVFTAGSPMVFGNYIQTIGYFDIYGCVAALVLLLIPARSFAYVIAAALLSMALIVIHHIQTLMFVPTLIAIVIARYYLVRPRSMLQMASGALAVLPVIALFWIAQFVATAPVPLAEFHAHMISRMAGPTFPRIDSGIWYQSAQSEFERTWAMMGKNLARVPIYLLVLAAHLPVIAYFRRAVTALDDPAHRRLAWLAVAGVSLGYLLICLAVSDYARWFSNWFVCMVLLLFAMRGLPSSEPIAIADDRSSRRLGWVVTAIPRIGSTIPF